MKRSFVYIVIVVLALFFGGILSGCSNVQIEGLVSTQICETRDNFFCKKNDDFVATFTDGMREEPFKMDGTKGKMVEYGVVVVRDLSNLMKKLSFELEIDGQIIVANFEKNPFDGTFVFDICKKVGKNAQIKLKIDGSQDALLLENVSQHWSCNQTKALNVFVNAKRDKLLENVKNGKFEGEIFVKIVGEEVSNDMFYYILCVTKNGEVLSTLVDVNTCEIVQS